MEKISSLSNIHGSMRILLMYQPSPAHLEALQTVAPQAEIVFAESEESAREKIKQADAVLGNRYFLQSLPLAKRLRWMQSGSSGMDLILGSKMIPDSLQITSARGIYDEEVAEHTIALAFALLRGLHLFRDAQKASRWHRFPLRCLSQIRSLILGWGGIGQAIGQKLLGLGSSVHAVTLKKKDSGFPRIPLHGLEEWELLLPQTDLLIIALPLTSLTRGLVSFHILGQLSASSYLINIGRGEVVVEAAILEHLHSGQLQGAALDVFSEEPLSFDHPFWQEERLLMTPHVGRSPEMPPYRWEPLFIENLRRFYNKEPLLNMIDKEAGY